MVIHTDIWISLGEKRRARPSTSISTCPPWCDSQAVQSSRSLHTYPFLREVWALLRFPSIFFPMRVRRSVGPCVFVLSRVACPLAGWQCSQRVLPPPCAEKKKDFAPVLRVATTESKLSPPASFSVGDLAQISVYCLLTVLPETYLGERRSTHIQISDVLGVMTTSLMPAGPDVWHMLDTSSMRVSLSLSLSFPRASLLHEYAGHGRGVCTRARYGGNVRPCA